MARKSPTADPREDDGATVGHEVQLRGIADALLPGLISGELRLKDDERFVEGVV